MIESEKAADNKKADSLEAERKREGRTEPIKGLDLITSRGIMHTEVKK
jgi:hypothetical protein